MDIKVTPKLIKEMCGLVSFKKGDSFLRWNKVKFDMYSPNRCEAIVTGTEDFYVTIEKEEHGQIRTKCTCPKLASFQKDCQHIAAVLLAIYENGGSTTASEDENQLSETLLTLFKESPKRSSREQRHFEKRQVLDVEFLCKVVSINDTLMFGIEMIINGRTLKNVREFLTQVNAGNPSLYSLYNPTMQCFQIETYAVISELMKIIHNEQVLGQGQVDDDKRLLVLPTDWEKLLPLLEKAPFVKLAYQSHLYHGLDTTDELPFLQFSLEKESAKCYQLKVNGLKHLTVMTIYNSVLADGKVIRLESDDCKRLYDLNKMLNRSKTNKIPIEEGQLNFFLEKVVPGLKRLGNVQIAPEIVNGYLKRPLLAKLYLDRVKNRLLAGLEFHYENIVINPLENEENHFGIKVMRDLAKEEAILRLMEEGNFTKTDGGFFLHNEELEYEFLYHIVPRLEQLVQIYATTAVKIRIFKGNARPQIKIKAKKDRTNWLEFKFAMDDIPDSHIQDILEALEEKRKYYRLPNGAFLPLETNEFKEIQRFMTQVPAQHDAFLAKGLQVPIVQGLKLIDSVHGSDILKLEKSFLQFLNDLQNPDKIKIAMPIGFAKILRDYQKHGFQWLKTLASYGFGGILADDMGLGKTLQSITFIVSELNVVRNEKKPVLIVAPSSLTYNWFNELKKFAPDIHTLIVDGQQTDRIKKLKSAKSYDVIITSYPLLRSDINSFEKLSFHTVFFDEAQAFKNPVTQTARSVKRIQADHRFALTGTPVENSIEELWSIFHVVFPELFQGLKEYSNLSRETIARRSRPFLLRRLKEDVLLELPEKIESTERTDLLPEQKKLYAAYLAKLKHETLKHLDKNTLRKNRIKILAGLTRLRQICCHPGLFVDGYEGNSAKFQQLLQILEEAKLSGRRVLVFSQFTKMLELIGKSLIAQGRSFFYLDGQTPSEERVETCQRFNQGERDLFLISLKAGGTGLNLTGADTVILYDIWWNPAVEEQAADRAHRIGQINSVQVIKLIARGTIEEKISELQEKKKHIIEQIIDPKENVSSTLTDEDIIEILSD